jgi:hypothetical protein
MYVIKHIGIDPMNPCAAGVDVMPQDKDEIHRELRLGQPPHKYAKA